MKQLLSVIIVTHQSEKYIQKCIQSVKRESVPTECIVIDNASTDRTVNEVQTQFPNISVIQNRENVGFSQAVNQVLPLARGNNILLLNPDTEVYPGSLKHMISFLQKKRKPCIIGGNFVSRDGKQQASFGNFPSVWVELAYSLGMYKLFPIGRFVPYNYFTRSYFTSVRKVDWVSGGAMMFPQKLINTIGTLDPHYFLYIEDIDFCKRAADHDINTYFLPNVKMYHARRASSRGKEVSSFLHEYQGLLYYCSKFNVNIHWIHRFIRFRLFMLSFFQPFFPGSEIQDIRLIRKEFTHHSKNL